MKGPLPRRGALLLLLPLLLGRPLSVQADSGQQASLQVLSSMLKDILRSGTDSAAASILSVPQTGQAGSVLALIRRLCDGPFLSLSFSLLSLTFVVALINTGFTLSSSMEDLARPFLGFAAALCLVRETPVIIQAGLQGLGALCGLLSSPGSPAEISAMHSALMDQIRPRITGFFSGFFLILELFLPWLASLLLSLLIRVIALSVLIRIFVRAALLPLGYGDLILHGLDGEGFCFLKKFAASLLSLALCLLLGQISAMLCAGSFLPADDLPRFLQGVLGMLSAQGCCALLMSQSERFAQEALGV